MTETPARITRVCGDSAWVTRAAPSSCGACGGRGCGSSLFSRFWRPDEPEYQVDNPIGAGPGERVVIGLPDGALWRAALASYIAPLASLLLCAILGSFAVGEPGAIVGGLLGLALAAVWLARRRDPRCVPVILRRDTEAPVCGARAGDAGA